MVTSSGSDAVAMRQVEYWPLERLKPYVANTRTHSPEQVRRIAASMEEFGWTVPCLVDNAGVLIGRWEEEAGQVAELAGRV